MMKEREGREERIVNRGKIIGRLFDQRDGKEQGLAETREKDPSISGKKKGKISKKGRQQSVPSGIPGRRGADLLEPTRWEAINKKKGKEGGT